MAQEFGLKIVSVADLIKYRLKTESLIERGEAVKLPTRYGDFTMILSCKRRPEKSTWR